MISIFFVFANFRHFNLIKDLLLSQQYGKYKRAMAYYFIYSIISSYYRSGDTFDTSAA